MTLIPPFYTDFICFSRSVSIDLHFSEETSRRKVNIWLNCLPKIYEWIDKNIAISQLMIFDCGTRTRFGCEWVCEKIWKCGYSVARSLRVELWCVNHLFRRAMTRSNKTSHMTKLWFCTYPCCAFINVGAVIVKWKLKCIKKPVSTRVPHSWFISISFKTWFHLIIIN